MQANSTYSCVKRMRRVVFRGLGGVERKKWGDRDFMHFWETDRKFCRCEGSRRRALVLLIKVGQRQYRGLRIDEDKAMGSRLC